MILVIVLNPALCQAKRMKKCAYSEVGLKSYFLGPQAENSGFLIAAMLGLTDQYSTWRKAQFPQDGTAISTLDQHHPLFLKNQKAMQTLMQDLSAQFQGELPHYSPRYLGHMFSELSLPGLFGHLVALLHNPNNISKESSRVGLKIESEAIQSLCKMLRWPQGVGHFTSGGTVANLEALLRMRNRLSPELWPKAKLLTSAAAHYSWKKNLKIMGLPDSAFLEIPLDKNGRFSIEALSRILNEISDPILGVVTLFGSTECGTIDPIERVNTVLKNHRRKKIWHHVDAAYGGFFACVSPHHNAYLTTQARALAKVDSLTLDPHKLGYIPFGCGAFLSRKKEDYFYSHIDAPYIQFQSAQEAGVQSVEGSRPATGAAATWLTSRTLGFNASGLGKVLERQLKTKHRLEKSLQRRIKGLIFAQSLDLNILCWTVKTPSGKLSDSNRKVDQIFKRLQAASEPYYVSKTSLPLAHHEWLRNSLQKKRIRLDKDSCHFVRMTLMNPFLSSKETQTEFIRDFVIKVHTLLTNSKK